MTVSEFLLAICDMWRLSSQSLSASLPVALTVEI